MKAYLVIISLVIVGCTQQQRQIDYAPRISTLEQRIFYLEEQNAKVVKAVQDKNKALLIRVKGELKAIRRSIAYLKDDMRAMQLDMEQGVDESSITHQQVLNNRRSLKAIIKRVGNQAIALNELSRFLEAKAGDPVLDLAEQKAYDRAFAHYRKKEFIKASSAFRRFRTRYGQSKLAEDALFFEGYALYLSKKFDQAALRFITHQQRYPRVERAEEVIWWLAVSLERSGDKLAAIDHYKKLAGQKKKSNFKRQAKTRLTELR